MGKVQREVPGADDSHDADRLPVDPHLAVLSVGGMDGAVHPSGERSRLLGDAVRERNLDIGLQRGGAGFSDQPIDNLLATLLQQVSLALSWDSAKRV